MKEICNKEENEICDCECHTGYSIMHFMPCCFYCPSCGKNIITNMYNKHIETCNLNKEKSINDMEIIMSNTNIKILLKKEDSEHNS